MKRSARYCQITVRRPNGQIETLRHPKVSEMTDALWAQFCAAMSKAGRGEGLSYKNMTEELPLSLEEQREALTYDLVAALDASDAAMARAHASGIGNGVSEASAKVREAEAALEAFDSEHPEVRAALQAERAAVAERNQWN